VIFGNLILKPLNGLGSLEILLVILLQTTELKERRQQEIYLVIVRDLLPNILPRIKSTYLVAMVQLMLHQEMVRYRFSIYLINLEDYLNDLWSCDLSFECTWISGTKLQD
jgi:hypothetical protein